MAWPGNRVQEMVIAKLLLRLSLNNPSNVCHCSKEICHKNDREREREKRERASWMPMDMAIPLQCFVRISDKKTPALLQWSIIPIHYCFLDIE